MARTIRSILSVAAMAVACRRGRGRLPGCRVDVWLLPTALAGAHQQWQFDPGGCFNSEDLGMTANQTGDPSDLLRRLAAHGSAKLVSRTGNGADQVGLWSYSYARPALPPMPRIVNFTGTVTVDASTEYVTRLTVRETFATQESRLSIDTVTYAFSDFGAPVTATAPTPPATSTTTRSTIWERWTSPSWSRSPPLPRPRSISRSGPITTLPATASSRDRTFLSTRQDRLY
jgi:hypothetical protein